MVVNTLIIAVILVAIIMLALGIKLLFNKDAEFTIHSCAFKEGSPDEEGVCPKCELKDLADCPEKDGGKNNTIGSYAR
jgi:hypothetical protein